jgi:ribosomal peptide maturation radical SAM protein 1
MTTHLPVVGAKPTRPALVPGARGDISQLTPEQRARRRSFGVALVSMPFQSNFTPSIQLGLLAAIADSHGFPTETFHLALELSQRVGHRLYESLALTLTRRMGEWFFSNEAFDQESPDRDGRFLDDFPAEAAMQLGKRSANGLESADRELILRIRNEIIPAYLDAMMADIDWGSFCVVGFSTVFQQTTSSIALARRIKQSYPHVEIVFGGPNAEGEMGDELMRRTPCIDYMVNGEGDVSFPELLVALAEEKSTCDIPGVLSRVTGDIAFGGDRPLFEEMDTLPTPRYAEFFARAEATGLFPPSKVRSIHSVRIPFESSRGCWWGQKHHCTFCGLNANGMRYRSKSPSRVLSELGELTRAHGSIAFTAVDNIIDLSYVKTLFKQIIEEGRDYQLFYETKANLTRETVKTMRAAGVVLMQPGIESLNTHVLQLMRKGTTAAHNVNLLRWARYYGIHVFWSILWGFPGEIAEDYAEQAKLIPYLAHLEPPVAANCIRMDRFSPLYEDREAFPIQFRTPEPSYAYAFPDAYDLNRLAYSFEYRLEKRLEDEAYADLLTATDTWIRAWKTEGFLPPAFSSESTAPTDRPMPWLTFSYSADVVQISDFRGEEESTYVLEGPAAQLYKAASDRPVGVQRAIEIAGVDVAPAAVERAFGELCESGLMMRDGSSYLALALPATPGR